ncbi:unnamed protein product [Cyberlindnera jadinii]|uniref:Roadblock/LAMTOR2 domain-containing protein n=1 Tax=Cyberlindnera jadinii (strain ATCC 18201 / CBS 1600 / BCRC 20928 / JCM 3617 / NBRC 0987 / NRRL Y-1542) TaxID=983966 RepID=A0A0H5C3D3_CYBJN|nr:hypothetical protein CYBJADRAFT_160665 [Cyberlindnera jadinii NRRL Y-1542]ODV75217.1 hypothetical protein CYBJADRAFT_160665 [Cyberlindnera jadinii NRRL Y-1542]CEP22376.1 unnamed protein product [Cyberlindnera jadinii]
MGMFVARNIESLLEQAVRGSRTTDSQVTAVTITKSSGVPLCTVTSKDFSVTKIKMFALLAARQGITLEVQRFEAPEDDDDEKIYGSLVPGTEYGVIFVTERNFPEGLIKIRMRNLTEQLKDLAKFDEAEEYS